MRAQNSMSLVLRRCATFLYKCYCRPDGLPECGQYRNQAPDQCHSGCLKLGYPQFQWVLIFPLKKWVITGVSGIHYFQTNPSGRVVESIGTTHARPKRYTIEWMQANRERERQDPHFAERLGVAWWNNMEKCNRQQAEGVFSLYPVVVN